MEWALEKRRAVIVHCWDGNPDYCWYPETKKELEALGFQVEIPAMPETGAPKLSLWLPKLQEVAGQPNENLFLIGHSAGTVTIMRYLESLPDDARVGGVVLVAGYTESLGFRELENFFTKPLHFDRIKPKAKKFVLIHSDNDPFVPIQYGNRLKEELDAELIVKHNMGHFSGAADDEAACLSLPDVNQAIKKMI